MSEIFSLNTSHFLKIVSEASEISEISSLSTHWEREDSVSLKRSFTDIFCQCLIYQFLLVCLRRRRTLSLLLMLIQSISLREVSVSVKSEDIWCCLWDKEKEVTEQCCRQHFFKERDNVKSMTVFEYLVIDSDIWYSVICASIWLSLVWLSECSQH